ncbi:uncharacterized protein LOC107611297 [Arachis ipaensis]|uniref:uncharacterized protein LOC107611297 n=1 Tax=Arachis ipaensis TaxID=130454 RepID=UPI0007AF61A9|nr:uncharacterized protein LOC107611297 [Arachis ipaensis]XP_025670417.1 uncharacterized protein LOC112770240 [Arachis hypogaea]
MAANLDNGGDARKVLGSYTAPNSDFYGRSISIPTIGANNFELKSQLVTLICHTVNTSKSRSLQVYTFPFAVRDKARLWLDSQPKESLDTWEKAIPILSDLATIVSNLSKTTHSFMAETRSSIRNLEIQVGQMSKKILEIPSNTFSSNTGVNPKEECKALTVEVVTEPKEEPAVEELKEIKAHEEFGNIIMHAPLQREEHEEYPSSDEQEEPKEEQIARFLVILRKLKANSSHAEGLEKDIPSMACLKASKGDEPVVLTKECSALVQKRLPQKLPDPRSFLIPCAIGTINFEKALCDLGSSINLIPLFVMKKLGIQEVQPAMISLEMAEKSLKRAYDMVKDVLVKFEDLYLPADFVILDTGEDRDNSIILERPFLATAKALIDVEKGELVLRLWEDHILFKIPNSQSPSDK